VSAKDRPLNKNNAGRPCNAVMQVKKWTVKYYMYRVRVVRISSKSERDGIIEPPIQYAVASNMGCMSKRCSSSTRPGSFARDCQPAHSQDALPLQVLAPAVLLRRWCSNSHCCCDLDEGAPTRGTSCGSDRRRGAIRPRSENVQARPDGLAWMSPVRKRCHRTFCSGGGG
jgi:hypothetical protein